MTDRVTHYALEVLEGRIVVGKYARLACQRHIDDIARQGTDKFPYVFDIEKANRVFDFFAFCRHVKGALAGQAITLDPFQEFIVGSIFGWVHRGTGLRRFRKAYVQVARGNGKTTLLSGLGLYMLMADNEPGSEVYATATAKKQARICYGDAKVMAENSPDLFRRLTTGRDQIYHARTNSKFEPLSKETKSHDGLAPHLAVVDEYHAHPTDEMLGVLVSAMGKRRQPILFMITTAGFDLSAPCYIDEYTYCCKVLERTLESDASEQYFIYIAQLDDRDSPQDERVWIKANPLLAKTAEGMEYLRTELQTALDVPSKMRGYLTKNMNMWVDRKPDGYMPMDKWKEVEVDAKDFPDLRGKECYVGVDLSAKIDLTSVAFEFPLDPGRYALVSHSFMPAETVAAKRKTDKVPYDAWIKQEFITETEGAVVDYDFVMQYVKDKAAEHGWVIREICYDPYNGTQFANDMAKEGYSTTEIRQGMPTLSEPTKDFRERVYDRKMLVLRNPVLRWAMSNAVTKQDHNQNIMLDKNKSRERIDPAAAAMNAHVVAKRHWGGPKTDDVSEFATEEVLKKLWG